MGEKFELIDGHRRLQAYRLLGKKETYILIRQKPEHIFPIKYFALVSSLF